MTTALTTQEEMQLDKLVADAERNRKEAQQFAIEAGSLLTATTNRLCEYKDRGFFKRCWYAISGKQGELERANVEDLAKMQKFAWAYLMKLQEQNLIEAKAIAVIRNNLKDLQFEVGELHDMISQIVKKFDARVTRLEEVSALHDWIIHIQANEGKFDKSRPAICLMQILFDYLSVLRANNIKFDAIERREDLQFAFQHFNIDPTIDYTIEGFITELATEVIDFGIDNFKKIVQIQVGEKVVPYEDLLKSVAGTGFNAFYKFVIKMDGMKDVLQFLDRNKVDEVVKGVLQKTLSNGEVRYSTMELGREIIGGSLVVHDVFSDEVKEVGNNLSRESSGGGFDIESLLSSYVTVSSHAFLSTNPSKEEKQTYLESFALIYAGIGGYSDSSYVSALAKLFECETSVERIKLLSQTPQRIDVPAVIRALSAVDKRKYMWCVDAMFVGQENGVINDKVKAVVLSMCKALGLAQNELAPVLDDVNKLVAGNDPKSIFDAIKNVHRFSDAWRTIVEFKRISMKGAFGDLSQRIMDASLKTMHQTFEVTSFITNDLSFNLFEASDYQIVSHRDERVKDFNRLRDSIASVFSEFEDLVKEFNEVRAAFGTKYIDCPLDISGIKCDDATNIENENWDDNLQNAIDDLNAAIDKVSTGLELFGEQLDLYEEGKFTESAIENRETNAANAKAKREAEDNAQKTLEIQEGGLAIRLRAEYEKLTGLPFEHDNIKSVCSFSGQWFVLTYKDGLWKSCDGKDWQKVELPEEFGSCSLDTVASVNSTLIVYDNWSQQFCFSSDGTTFLLGMFPSDVKDFRVFSCDGAWVLFTQATTEYAYKKGSGFFASDETGTYNINRYFVAESLDGDWQELKEFSLRSGDYIQADSFAIFGENMFGVSSVDSFYTENMHIQKRTARLLYAFDKDGWQVASYDSKLLKFMGDSDQMLLDAKFFRWKGVYICLTNDHALHSEDGRSWVEGSGKIRCGGCTKLVELDAYLVAFHYDNSAYLTADGKDYSLIKLDHVSDKIASNGREALTVETDKNKGGVFLMRISRV